MKKILLLLLLLPSPLMLSQARAQGLHGRILLLDQDSSAVGRLKTAIASNYSGAVDDDTALPADLSNYDAILIEVGTKNFYPFDTLSIEEQLSLIEYVQDGGKLYAEVGGFFLTGNFAVRTDTNTPGDTLWHFLGLREESLDALEDTYSLFYGVDSEFTQGLSIPHKYDPIDVDVGGTYYPFGNITPVLYGQEVGGGQGDVFAMIPSDTSLHVVLHHDPGLYYPAEYYQPFLSRVLCDYFGLCEEAVKAVPMRDTSLFLRVMSDVDGVTIIATTDQEGVIEVMNALGATVYRKSVASGTNEIPLFTTLSNGVYFARLETADGTEVKSFAMVRQ